MKTHRPLFPDIDPERTLLIAGPCSAETETQLLDTARALAALAGAGIEIVLITTSDLDISLLIRQQDEDTALDALHKAFAV